MHQNPTQSPTVNSILTSADTSFRLHTLLLKIFCIISPFIFHPSFHLSNTRIKLKCLGVSSCFLAQLWLKLSKQLTTKICSLFIWEFFKPACIWLCKNHAIVSLTLFSPSLSCLCVKAHHTLVTCVDSCLSQSCVRVIHQRWFDLTRGVRELLSVYLWAVSQLFITSVTVLNRIDVLTMQQQQPHGRSPPDTLPSRSFSWNIKCSHLLRWLT